MVLIDSEVAVCGKECAFFGSDEQSAEGDECKRKDLHDGWRFAFSELSEVEEL